ncbi:uncharacterized protein LOC6564518 [Drosophila grimshawi]|uniref:GH12441 n=1 Tax=Drosophila grimshawi TaxID=7222 RepID=B4JJ72_DROGR|nr:uncharacterized protein LOC6564518 [Drosophila grimshawi]EDV99624.1 GH12441 [Drosophila grimshawi]
MLKRNLQRIHLTLADLEEYQALRRRNKLRATIDASRSSSSSVTATATETAPSTDSNSTSETPVTQRHLEDLPAATGWATAVVTNSNTNSGSTEDDTSVAAVVDDNDTIAELSDDGWVDIDEEDGARGGEP